MRTELNHELEAELNAPASDILEAISRGFRAKVDVKGKLAELYLARQCGELRNRGVITDFSWHDADGHPDFEVLWAGSVVLVECKNVRANKRLRSAEHATVELQKTRGGTDAAGRPTRGYRVDHFDILGACLFNVTGEWEFRFAVSKQLARRDDAPDVLTVMQSVHLQVSATWHATLEAALESLAHNRRQP